MRVIAEETWGLLRENVIGTAAEYEYKDGRLSRQTKVLGNVALGPGKPEAWFEVCRKDAAVYGRRSEDDAVLKLDPQKADELLKAFKEI